MRVVHLALTDGGGAGMGMINQHRALLSMGIDSRVLVATKHSPDSTIVQMEPNHNSWGDSRYMHIIERAACRLGLTFNDYDTYHHLIYNIRKHHNVAFDNPYSQYDVLQHPLVDEADIVNLHYVSEFVDIPSFFGGIKKPVVWTMRDESAGLGGFHYSQDKERYYQYYAKLEDNVADIKRKALAHCHTLHIVSLSQTMQRFCNTVDFLSQRPNTIIYNAIEPQDYMPQDRNTARRKYGIKDTEKVVLFVGYNLNEERKGLHVLLKAIGLLDNEHLRLVCVGHGTVNAPKSVNVVNIGAISNSQKISEVYSMADVFVNASSQESFGKTIVEALYCGTPVVTTRVGIAPEIITPRNGTLCDSRTPESLCKAIGNALDTTYDPESIRHNATQLFAPSNIAAKYVGLYNSYL